MFQSFVTFFTAPKRSKGVLRYFNEVITYIFGLTSTKKNHEVSRQES